MTNEHPIIPPASLLDGWFHQHYGSNKGFSEILIEVAQWGADQELEACCEWIDWHHSGKVNRELRAARRPEPLSLKEQALLVLDDANLDAVHENILRRALEQLDD